MSEHVSNLPPEEMITAMYGTQKLSPEETEKIIKRPLTPEEKKLLKKEYVELLKKLISEGLTPETWRKYFDSRQNLVNILEVVGCDKYTHGLLWGGVHFSMRSSYCAKNCPFKGKGEGYALHINYNPLDEGYLLYTEKKRLPAWQRSVLEVCNKYNHSSFVSFTKVNRRPMNMKNAKRIR